MDKYKNFSVEDLLQDEFFFQWVTHPNSGDTELWDSWLIDNPEMFVLVNDAKEIILASSNLLQNTTENFYENLKKRIDTTLIDEDYFKIKPFLVVNWLKLAAVLIGLFVAGTLLSPTREAGNYKSYTSRYGEIKKILLPDGSTVVLNANSTLTYKFGRNNIEREVWLKGEGYFSIKHLTFKNPLPLKFIVHTKDLNVEVLGTEFNVDNIDENKTSVLLTKGKVKLSVNEKMDKPLEMKPNEYLLYNDKTNNISISKVAPGSYIAWLENKYVFEKTTLEDLSKELHRYYGKSVSIENANMKKQRLSGTLELKDEDSLIQTLSILLGVSITKNDNEIVIGSK